MTLTDTGPLVALLNRNDPSHGICLDAVKRLPRSPLVTTWPCLTEAMFLLYRVGGYPAQESLWNMRKTGLLLHEHGATEVVRMAELMAKYRDLPMDLADASVMAAAEQLRPRRVFTIDRDFRVYRFPDGGVVEVIP